MKDTLATYQKIAYQMLTHDLVSQQISHAYLFLGPAGNHKKEAAILFAQSLVCPNTVEGWACEECEVCQRIQKGEYSDIKILDGSKASIKKGDVEELQNYFSLTALEKYGKKAYIINAFDNMTIPSMNSLLKFLEEPNQSITAILCSDNPDRILPTIISRCKPIPFVAPNAIQLEEIAKEEGLLPLDAHILAENSGDANTLSKIAESEEYQTALHYWLEFINQCAKGIDNAIFYLEAKAFTGNDKEKAKSSFPWFLKIGLVFAQDLLDQKTGYDSKWDQRLKTFSDVPLTIEGLMMILLDCKDRLLMKTNVALTIDHFGYLLKKEAMQNVRKQ